MIKVTNVVLQQSMGPMPIYTISETEIKQVRSHEEHKKRLKEHACGTICFDIDKLTSADIEKILKGKIDCITIRNAEITIDLFDVEILNVFSEQDIMYGELFTFVCSKTFIRALQVSNIYSYK